MQMVILGTWEMETENAGEWKLAPVIGNVCMDMLMLDITGINAEEEDTVIVFGEDLPVSQIAQWAGTIPYEILCGVSQRVRRVYYEE